MDVHPRLNDMFFTPEGNAEQIIGFGKITTIHKNRARRAQVINTYPNRGDAPENKSVLGASMAYYLHRCLRYAFRDLGRLGQARQRPMALAFSVIQSWITLVVACTSIERYHHSFTDKPKGDHNYVGVVDFFITWYMHMFIRFEFGIHDFSRLHMFYSTELPKCRGFWPFVMFDGDEVHHAQFHTLADYIVPNAGAIGIQGKLRWLQYVDERLSSLWTNYMRPVAQFMHHPTIYGDRAAITAATINIRAPGMVPADVVAVMKNFFLLPQEAGEMIARHAECRPFHKEPEHQTVQPYVKYFGGGAILSQIQHYLKREPPELAEHVKKFIDQRIAKIEAKNIAAYLEIEEYEGMAMHQAMHIADLQGMMDDTQMDSIHDIYMTSVAHEFINVYENEEFYPHCSAWKAASRLFRFKFTIAPPEPTPRIAPAPRRGARGRGAARTPRHPDTRPLVWV
jgi:hypothetical protein